MFDFMKQKEPELDEYEVRYLESRANDNKVSDIEKQNLLLKEKTLKKEK